MVNYIFFALLSKLVMLIILHGEIKHHNMNHRSTIIAILKIINNGKYSQENAYCKGGKTC
jgi:hypothetical protein